MSVSRPTRRRRALVVVLCCVGVALPAAPAFGVPSRDLAAPCTASTEGVLATVGAVSPFAGDIAVTSVPSTDPVDLDVRGLDRTRGRFPTSALDDHEVALRVVRRRGRLVRTELCDAGIRVVVLPRPPGGSRFGALSVRGSAVAWRTWRPGRSGRVWVGRVRAGRIVGVRGAATPAVADADGVDGALQVGPDGTAAWALRVRDRRALWMWPRGRRPARVVDGTTAPVAPTAGVRILDDRHVVVGESAGVARYGRPTPGRCPRVVDAWSRRLGPFRVVRVAGARWGEDDPEDVTMTGEWDQTLVCDPALGDYVAGAAGGGFTGKGTGALAYVSRAYATAGVVVLRGRTDRYDYQAYDSRIVVAGTGAVLYAEGPVAGPGVRPPTPRESFGPYRPLGPQAVGTVVTPGAAAWTASGGAGGRRFEPLDVWLADAGGVRVVGAVTAPDPLAGVPTPDPRLTLAAGVLSWSEGGVRRELPVQPRTGDTVATVRLPELR